ncbi:MAG: flagellar basal body P-ring protein FlgI [Phycisphaerales bacterium]
MSDHLLIPAARSARVLTAIVTVLALSCATPAQNEAVTTEAAGAQDGASAAVAVADVISIQDIARIGGQGESVLRGFGLVTGLKGTGDKGTDPVLALPLVEVYKANGLPLPNLKSVAGSKSVALVMLECRIPREGARKDDQLDVYITTSHSASSLAGGRLVVAPLLDPMAHADAAQTPVYGFAFGPIEFENASALTSGVIRGGGRIATDILMREPGDRFSIILEPPFRTHAVAEQVARTINGSQPDLEDEAGGALAPVATVVDDATIRVEIPRSERANRARFISEVMTAKFSPSLLKLPAMVLVNSRTGSIIASADVEISAVAIVHKNLVVTSITPPPVGTPQAPISTQSRTAGIRTTDRPSDKARLADLLAALKALDVPIEDQISILTEIHQTGRLHARLVVQ